MNPLLAKMEPEIWFWKPAMCELRKSQRGRGKLTICTGGESSNGAEKEYSTESPDSFHQRQSIEFRFQLVLAELGCLEVVLVMSILISEVFLVLEVDFGVFGISMVLLNQCVWLAHVEGVFWNDEQ